MNIVTVGLNHRTAPVEIREQFAFTEEELPHALRRLVNHYNINETVIISTCNRVEVIGVVHDMEKGVWEIKKFLSEYHNIPYEDIKDHLYVHAGEDCARHLFRVACGLDSMVMGEPQILGQVKDAYGMAVQSNTAGTVINKLFHKAFSVAKRVRTETRIGASSVSVSSVAVELAKKIFGELTGRTVMLIGAGEMAELSARSLLGAGVKEIIIANRTYERAVELAKEFRGRAIMFREFPHYLKYTDIVIASTGSPKFIIRPEDVAGVMKERKHCPMFFIDIAVPRNIDPLVNNIDNAYVFDIDDLQGVVEANLKERLKEAEQAELIVAEEIEGFYRWVRSLDVVPTIIALQQRLESIRKAELERALAQLKNLSDRERKVLDAMTQAMVKKILHSPVTCIKQEAHSVEGDTFIEAAIKLFGLEEEEIIKKAREGGGN